MRTLYLTAALALAAATPASAAGSTPAATGLPGTSWAVDCKEPASSSNYYLEYSVASDGQLVETLKSDKSQARKIRNIQMMSKDWLLYTLDDTDGEAVNILTFTDKLGRKKTWWSVGNNGKAYVVEGDGVPWFTQCK